MSNSEYIFSSLKYLLNLIRRQKLFELFTIILITIFISISNSLVPIFYKYVIDEILIKHSKNIDKITIAVIIYLTLYSVIFIVSQVCWPIKRVLFSNFMLKLEQTMLYDVFHAIKEKCKSKENMLSSGVIINYMDRGQSALRKLFMDFIYYALHHFIKLITIIVVLVKMVDIKYIYILGSFTFFYLLITIHLQKGFPLYLDKVKHFRDKLSELTIKYLNQEDTSNLSQCIDLLSSRQFEEKKLNIFIAFNKAIQHFLYSFAITLIFCICAIDLINERISVGDMVMINTFAINFFNPIRSLGYLLEDFNKDIFDIKNIHSLLRGVTK